MNERIKQLAEQAKEYARGFNYQHEVFEKKFALLMVGECIARVELQANEFGDAMRIERAAAAWEISQDLREYFGVEE